MTLNDLAGELGLNTVQTWRLRPKLEARGMLPVRISPRRTMYRRADFNRVIDELAESGEQLA